MCVEILKIFLYFVVFQLFFLHFVVCVPYMRNPRGIVYNLYGVFTYIFYYFFLFFFVYENLYCFLQNKLKTYFKRVFLKKQKNKNNSQQTNIKCTMSRMKKKLFFLIKIETATETTAKYTAFL